MLLFGWGYLLAKLWDEPISAFKVYVAWALIRGIVLNAYLWANWPGYSDAYWITRAVTMIVTGAVVGELWADLRPKDSVLPTINIGSLFGVACAFYGYFYAQLLFDRLFGFAICAACVLRLIWRNSAITQSRALGLLVLTLFPAIAEMPYVLDLGGWLRFTPVYAGLVCQVIWIYGRRDRASIASGATAH